MRKTPETPAAERALVLKTLRAVRSSLQSGTSRWNYSATVSDFGEGKFNARKPNPEPDPATSVAQWMDLALRCEHAAETLTKLAGVARIKARKRQEQQDSEVGS